MVWATSSKQRKGLDRVILSPILFNLVADMLATLISRAKSIGIIKGVIPHLINDGLSILHYANDNILFLEHDLIQAAELKLILTLRLSAMGRLKIMSRTVQVYFGAM